MGTQDPGFPVGDATGIFVETKELGPIGGGDVGRCRRWNRLLFMLLLI